MEEEEEAVSFNFYDSSHHGFAEKNAQVTDEGNPLETPTGMDVDDFEFPHISSDYDATAGEIFCEGQIRPVFPVFNRDLLTRNDSDQSDHGKKLTELLTQRLALEKSFRFAYESDDEERGPPSSPSSESEADDAYCVWRPEAVEKSPRRYKKSDSAGALASKQWKLSDFLHRRSSSEGMEDSFAFFTPTYGEQQEGEMRGTVESTQKAGKTNAKKKVSAASAHEAFCVRKLQGEKRKSFLPFKFYSSGIYEETAAEVTDEKKPQETLTDTEDDIEFTFVLGDSDLIADETSGEGQIRQLFPIFNNDLPARDDQSDGKKPAGLTLRLPLQKLFADELESVPAGEYSVWRPKTVDSSSRYKKCGSTGSALKWWKLRDLLLLRRRSNSEGKEGSSEFSFVPTEIVGVDEGQDCQIFPVFNRDLFICNDRDSKMLTRRLSLRQLFDDEDGDQGGNPVSPSSAKANELESVPVGTYSVWRPKIVGKKPAGRCKKCNLTRLGWKLGDSLLRRSYSEGTPKNSREHKGGEKEEKLFNDYKPSELAPRLSFKKLFTTGVGDKGRDPPLLSSSGADELESVPMGTYS
ncbi:hypothetical protein C3L33_01602, partial [Rhododendron williamsianum]